MLRAMFPKDWAQTTHGGHPDSRSHDDDFSFTRISLLVRPEFNALFGPKLTFNRLRVNVIVGGLAARTAGKEVSGGDVKMKAKARPRPGTPHSGDLQRLFFTGSCNRTAS